ncbi:hypothetical protein M433DRAFT_68959 [Acidomyces richmondensis BFW]|nr:MAG: hypothetical protein FE78DRAFT_151319 [Acidomyces sp. 'richmondensis']KYG44642.1 hypothetical protein M433DRAFT_68959 [Acidomyces richmondensis BFW]
MPMHPHPSRRQQDYHNYHHAPPPPQPPMHHPMQYAGYHNPYYPHPAQHPYQPPRWQPPYHQPPYMPPPPQHIPYSSHSPVVVTSQPPLAHSMTPVQRHTPMPVSHQQPTAPSPRAVSQHMPNGPAPAPEHASASASASHSPAPISGQQPEQEHVPTPELEHRIATPPAAPSRRHSQAQSSPLSLPAEHHTPFYPELPWYSIPEGETTFPRRDMARKRRRQNLRKTTEDVALPNREENVESTQERQQAVAVAEDLSENSTIAAPSEPETPATSQAPSESDFSHVSTPATPAQAAMESPTKATPTQPQNSLRRDTRTAIAVPNIAGLPRMKASPPAADKQHALPVQKEVEAPHSQEAAQSEEPSHTEEPATSKTPPPKQTQKSWADLVRTTAAPPLGAAAAGGTAAAAAAVNGAILTNGSALPKNASLSEALRQYTVNSDTKLFFLEPRGLVNTGNMCYMNSILQILVFCPPFYSFLDQVRQRTVHSMKSDTPLLDAMIMFMREFKVLASAESTETVRRMLKQEQLEQYGEPVTPEYVYDAIKKLPRFSNMRRGHQQDAEEFLGFLLEGLHDECATVMRAQAGESPQANGIPSPTMEASPESVAGGWLEVGKKQKASITRTAGQLEDPTPITKIFGGFLRSELRVPGAKDSVTLEPYKPLQLDIGAAHVHNIIDALKGLTRIETLTGDFGGKSGTSARKQVFIDSLPPVLVLHLKRFQYENSVTGTQKIWKKVGYPLELEIPKEVFPPAKRGSLTAHGAGGLPKYRLISVVYHHGKSAAGGHYTVDVLRQDGREWVRMDDTFIRRVRPEDVAEAGAEEDPKVLARALELHKAEIDLQQQQRQVRLQQRNGNVYHGLDDDDDEDGEGKEASGERAWSEVNGNASSAVGGKKWSTIAQGTAGLVNGTGTSTPTTTGKQTPTMARARKEGGGGGGVGKENKVAYILLYERIRRA